LWILFFLLNYHLFHSLKNNKYFFQLKIEKLAELAAKIKNGAYKRRVSFFQQFPHIMTILMKMRNYSRKSYEYLYELGIFPVSEKTARKIFLNPCVGVSTEAIRYFLHETRSYLSDDDDDEIKLDCVLSTDAIALKPKLFLLDDQLVGAKQKIHLGNLPPPEQLNYCKSAIFVQLHLAGTNLKCIVATFPVVRKGFDSKCLLRRFNYLIKKIKKEAGGELFDKLRLMMVSDQESIFSKIVNSEIEEEKLPIPSFFDIPHLCKCFRNSISNYLILLDGSLMNIKHLLQFSKENGFDLQAVVAEDKMSIPLLLKLTEFAKHIPPENYSCATIFPCPIFNANGKGYLADRVGYTLSNTLDIWFSNGAILYHATTNSSSYVKQISIPGIQHIASNSRNDILYCVKNGKAGKLDTNTKTFKVLQSEAVQCELLGDRPVFLSKKGTVHGLSKTYCKVIRLLPCEDSIGLLYSNEIKFIDLKQNEHVVKLQKNLKEEVLATNKNVIVTSSRILDINNGSMLQEFNFKLMGVCCFLNSFIGVDDDGKLHVFSPMGPLARLLYALDCALAYVDTHSLELEKKSQRKSDLIPIR